MQFGKPGIEALDALLPQTQCRKCGHAGCRPYAEAILRGDADVNQCPPGGDEVARDIAALLGIPAKPFDTAFGVHRPPTAARIDEAACIGCRLCIEACPVDAIVGAAKLMHTVMAGECTGCELCVPPCPVDCIRMEERKETPDAEARRRAAGRARRRFEARNARLAAERAAREARLLALREAAAAEERKRETVRRAIERAHARLRLRGG